jgi:dihydroorotase
MKSILLRGGRLIDPASRVDGEFDVLAVDGRIESVLPAGRAAAPEGAAIVDARRCWVVPGLIDAHVHLRDPGFPQKETILSGLRAAAAGGFTAVAAMANTNPVNDSPEVTGYMLARAREAHTTRLIPVSAVTRGLEGREPVDYAAMVKAGARLFSDDGIPVDDERILSRAMKEILALGYSISLHEEDRGLSCHGALNAGPIADRLGVSGYSNSAESERVRRDLALAADSGASVHIAHVSTRESLDLIRDARARGVHVTCEVTPHHFALDHAAALRWGPNAKMNPPLRAPGDLDGIREGIADGTIDLIASDHAPHDPASKHLDDLAGFFDPNADAPRLPAHAAELFAGCANGIVGLETSLGLAMDLVHRSLIGAPRLVEMMSRNPARLLRLEGGSLAPGNVADITVIDPNLDWTVQPDRFRSKSRNTPFAGLRLQGKAIMTIVASEMVYDGRDGGD